MKRASGGYAATSTPSKLCSVESRTPSARSFSRTVRWNRPRVDGGWCAPSPSQRPPPLPSPHRHCRPVYKAQGGACVARAGKQGAEEERGAERGEEDFLLREDVDGVGTSEDAELETRLARSDRERSRRDDALRAMADSAPDVGDVDASAPVGKEAIRVRASLLLQAPLASVTHSSPTPTPPVRRYRSCTAAARTRSWPSSWRR